LHVLKGDIIVYIDADIKNIHPRFVYGLIAPLIMNKKIKYVKAFYDRPIALDKGVVRSTGGGRVTELLIRPLLSLFFPDLTQIIQPLSGEYAGYRDVLDKIPFPIGYGVETSMILDIYNKWGLDVIGQVDLDRRVHRNQETKSLGRMSFGILNTFFDRIQKQNILKLNKKLFNEMIQYSIKDNIYKPEYHKIENIERQPMIEVNEYKKKFYN